MRTKRRFRNRVKRTIRKRVNKKMSGGNPEFTIMSFNVECWCNQIKPDNRDKFKNFMKGLSSETESEWRQMKSIFNGVDIA